MYCNLSAVNIQLKMLNAGSVFISIRQNRPSNLQPILLSIKQKFLQMFLIGKKDEIAVVASDVSGCC